MRIAAAEYLDAALTGDGDDLDGLSLLDRHMVVLDTWKYAVDDDPKNSQALRDAAYTLTSAAAKALLTGSKHEIAKIIRDPIIIGAIAFGGAARSKLDGERKDYSRFNKRVAVFRESKTTRGNIY